MDLVSVTHPLCLANATITFAAKFKCPTNLSRGIETEVVLARCRALPVDTGGVATAAGWRARFGTDRSGRERLMTFSLGLGSSEGKMAGDKVVLMPEVVGLAERRLSKSSVGSVCGGVLMLSAPVERLLRSETATTCLTSCSRRMTRSRSADDSARSEEIKDDSSDMLVGVVSRDVEDAFISFIVGLTSRSGGGGATSARLIPALVLRIVGIPRSLARDKTLCAGEASRPDDEDEIGGVSPDRRARFSSSSSATRTSSQARCAFR